MKNYRKKDKHIFIIDITPILINKCFQYINFPIYNGSTENKKLSKEKNTFILD